MSDARHPSGRFVLRVPPALHAKLTESARAAGRSLNEHCVRSLGEAEAVQDSGIAEVVGRALGQLGPDLVGVAIFGSYARGEAGPTSDVDVLIVAGASVEITRSLYGPWDVADLIIAGRRAEPHFVQLRQPGDPVSGLWAEVALDGAVVYDPRMELNRELVRIRRGILDGMLVRRSAGGHSWWTTA